MHEGGCVGRCHACEHILGARLCCPGQMKQCPCPSVHWMWRARAGFRKWVVHTAPGQSAGVLVASTQLLPSRNDNSGAKMAGSVGGTIGRAGTRVHNVRLSSQMSGLDVDLNTAHIKLEEDLVCATYRAKESRGRKTILS